MKGWAKRRRRARVLPGVTETWTNAERHGPTRRRGLYARQEVSEAATGTALPSQEGLAISSLAALDRVWTAAEVADPARMLAEASEEALRAMLMAESTVPGPNASVL